MEKDNSNRPYKEKLASKPLKYKSKTQENFIVNYNADPDIINTWS
jgi:hypothetical protein